MTREIISLDFETRSACNLIREGAYRYATCPTTQVICCSYKIKTGEIRTWIPPWVEKIVGVGDQAPWEYNPDAMYQAWNSQFDRLIWQYVCTNDYNWPDSFITDWICTSALGRTNGLPGKLENAAIALKLSQKKDHRGSQLIKLLSIPNGGTRYAPTFCEDETLLNEMCDYCEQDVRVESGIVETMRPFLPHELIEFHASEKINDRGIGFDLPFAKKAITYGDVEKALLEEELQIITKNEVEKTTQYQRVKKWLLAGYTEEEDEKGTFYVPTGETRISPEAVKMMTFYKKGQRKISLDKAVRNNLLLSIDTEPDLLTSDALEVIKLTDLANKSSVAKYKRMVEREIDSRICGAYMFAGAAGTGRFSAHGIQPHNMVRDCVKDFDESLKNLDSQTDTEVIHTLSKMMRPTIKSEKGKRLYWSDWSNVEGRALPWLADTDAADRKLDMFRRQDAHPEEPDVYERMAERMGLEERQTGKVAELAMGFGGGVGAFQAMARNYGVRVSDKEAKKIQNLWREANPWAKPFWYKLKNAAWDAMTNPDEFFRVGRVAYFYTEHTHNGLGTLWCQLPSKRLIAYVNPKFEHVPCPWNEDETMLELTAIKANFKPKQGEPEWPRHKLWYGVLAENITQAFCADLLRHALVQFEEACLEVVLHTHDEVVVKDDVNVSKIVKRIMEIPPKWAEGFPLAADINSGLRYTK